jgi:hypothetical protein
MSTQAWGWIADQHGNGLGNYTIQIKNLSGTAATHWDTVTGGTSSTADLTTNADGTLPRFIEEGAYTLVVPSVLSRRVEAVASLATGKILDWTATTFYRQNALVRDASGNVQRALGDFTSAGSFDQADWTQVPAPGESISVAGALRGEIVPTVDPGVWGPATRTLSSAGRTWVMRFSPRRAWSVTLAAWDVTVAASVDDSTEVAVYSADLTSRLSTTGVLTGKLNGTGIKTGTLTQAFDPSLVYYIAWKAPVALGGTGASVNGRTCNGISTTLFGTTVPTALAGFIDALSSPLPTSITAASVNWTALSTFPLLALREV